MDSQKDHNIKDLETIYLTKYQVFFRYAFIHTKDKCDAEELVHEAFCTAAEKWTSFNSSINPEGWIMQTLKNKISNFRRKNFSSWVVSLEEPWVKEIVFIHDFEIDRSIGLLEYCQHNLSDTENALLKYILFEGHSFIEASKLFHLSTWACQKKYQRILKKLRSKAETLCK